MMDNIADPVDRAVVEQEIILQEQLRIARQAPVQRLAYVGHCHNCHETLTDPHRFCDVDCRDDYEKIQRSRAQRIN